MSKQQKKVKPFSVYLEGERVEITKEMIEQSSPEVIEVYQRILWKQTKKEQREKRCLNPDGTRCQKTSCGECERIQKIDLKDPCNGLSLSLEEMEESGYPMPCSDPFMLPEEYVVKSEQYEELYAALTTLGDFDRNIIEMYYFIGMTEWQIGQELGVVQKTVNNHKTNNLETMREILTENQ